MACHNNVYDNGFHVKLSHKRGKKPMTDDILATGIGILAFVIALGGLVLPVSDACMHDGFKAYLGSNQTIQTATWTTVILDTEVFDDNNEFNPATYQGTIAETGRYLLCFQIVFSTMADGTDVEVVVERNSASIAYLFNRPGGAGYLGIAGSTVCNLNAGDVLRMRVYQKSGAPQTLRGTVEFYNFLSVIRIK